MTMSRVVSLAPPPFNLHFTAYHLLSIPPFIVSFVLSGIYHSAMKTCLTLLYLENTNLPAIDTDRAACMLGVSPTSTFITTRRRSCPAAMPKTPSKNHSRAMSNERKRLQREAGPHLTSSSIFSFRRLKDFGFQTKNFGFQRIFFAATSSATMAAMRRRMFWK